MLLPQLKAQNFCYNLMLFEISQIQHLSKPLSIRHFCSLYRFVVVFSCKGLKKHWDVTH